jgi:DNA-binding NarL/FixJ family response regulator
MTAADASAAHDRVSSPGRAVSAVPDDSVLHAAVQPQCSLSVQLRRVTGSVVGRPLELAAIQQELAAARSQLSAVTLEGEPGIGKTRLLVATSEIAQTSGFTPVAVTADEEIRGPFLLAQSVLAAPVLRDAVAGSAAETIVARAADAVSGRDEPGLETLAPDRKLLHAFDLAAVALGAAAAQRPLALLIDDLQWADDDTVRLLRYLVRAGADNPIFLLLAVRPDEMAQVSEAVRLVADMERMGIVRRLKLGRFTQPETAELLRQLLAGPVDPESAATMHAQSEGVPFIVEEIARTYRDAGMVQQIDGVWALASNAARLVPSAVRTLIQRRAARLPDDSRAALGDAAVLGRSFSLRDLVTIREQLGEAHVVAASLAEALAPAAEAGLLLPHPGEAPADFTFSHEQVREFAAAGLPLARRRAIHSAIVDMLEGDGHPPPASLPLLAHHALAAGDPQRAARFSVDAARGALEANAPEEVLRVVDQALPAASTPQDRLALLTARDDALAMLRRAGDRLDGLAELAALAEALGDSHVELDVQLRRAATLRLSEDDVDIAADLARRVRALAAERGDRAGELAACLELAQDLLRTSLGESFSPTASEVDLEGAEEALQRAVALGEELGDERSVAAATRELGVIVVARIRHWYVGEVQSGGIADYARRIAAGEGMDEILPTLPIAPLFHRASELYQRALDMYERLGDRRGVMSTLIAMAYVSYGPVIHLTSSARHIEEIRRLASRMSSMTKESERAQAELQMLYGVQVYAQAKVVPDLALARGEEAYRLARMQGDRAVEFVAAGGMALTHLDLGEVDQAERWLERASSAAASSPTPLRARQVELWRGMARAGADDPPGMRDHLERAVAMATNEGRPAARCEALARLAMEAARLGAARGDDELLGLAETAAFDAKEVLGLLPGHPPWGAQADGALARVALARGDVERAALAGGSALRALEEALHEDMNLDVFLPAARAILAGGDEATRQQVRGRLQLSLSGIVQRTLDEDARVRWLRGPLGRELAELAGPIERIGSGPEQDGRGQGDGLGDEDRRLLHLLTQGKTNREIATELSISEEDVTRRLGEIFTAIHASSRAEATAFAFREGIP